MLALIANRQHPLLLHGPRSGAAFTPDDDTVNPVQVDLAQVFQEPFDGEETHDGRRLAQVLDSRQAVGASLDADALPNMRQLGGESELRLEQVAQARSALDIRANRTSCVANLVSSVSLVGPHTQKQSSGSAGLGPQRHRTSGGTTAMAAAPQPKSARLPKRNRGTPGESRRALFVPPQRRPRRWQNQPLSVGNDRAPWELYCCGLIRCRREAEPAWVGQWAWPMLETPLRPRKPDGPAPLESVDPERWLEILPCI
jgi:hypothetical protein